MKSRYTQRELDRLVSEVEPRSGWDFSSMRTIRQAVPWNYMDVVRSYLAPTDVVADVGTGGGERFAELSDSFGRGVGIDLDPTMVQSARSNVQAANIDFLVSNEQFEGIAEDFDVILNRHAPFDLGAVCGHLKPGGIFITQQVGEHNMGNVKRALGWTAFRPPVRRADLVASDLRLIAFMEYDVEYVVQDIESLAFWLHALDLPHADIPGAQALSDIAVFNEILRGNVTERGFVTNEHRYLAIGQV